MRRAALSLVATITGLVLLLSYKSHAPGSLLRPSALQPAAPTGNGTPSTTPAASPSTAKAAVSKSVYGQPVNTRYGTVQVEVIERAGKITAVRPIQLPQQSGRDIEIDNFAVPQLIQETLTAQSAQIAMVSGATYTSAGYIQSLQSALDRL
jgi:uncharacterized protein with FMN-binding domain